jgi:hypothetical protein
MSRAAWLWPAAIIASGSAATVATLLDLHTAARAPLAFWFLLVCPGMALIRLLRLADPWQELTLALALSIALDAMVAGVLVYSGAWSAGAAVAILAGISLAGALGQLWRARPRPSSSGVWQDVEGAEPSSELRKFSQERVEP